MHHVDLTQIWPEWQIEGPPIGSGSFGSVFKAVRRDNGVETYSAIKVISIPKNQNDLDSLQLHGLDITYLQGIVNDCVSEIQLMESLRGIQNIVSVEDYKIVKKVDEIGWDIYIRMELLTPLTKYVQSRQLSEREVIKLGCDICTALEVCGKKGIIHRDIKPENIFVNEFGDFKLGDFGIARTLEGQNGNLSLKGTPNYMAPEVANNKEYDSRVDTYSLGVVLYLFLNKNRLPFLGNEKQMPSAVDAANAAARRIGGEKLPAPSNASAKLSAVVLRACAYNPKARFQTATQMKEALQDALNSVEPGEPKRRGRPVLVTLLVLLLLLGAGAAMLFSGLIPESYLPEALMELLPDNTDEETEPPEKIEEIPQITDNIPETEAPEVTTAPTEAPKTIDWDEEIGAIRKLVDQGEYLKAILAANEIMDTMGAHEDLSAYMAEMEVYYVDQVVQAAENQLAMKDYDSADQFVSEALKYFPDNELLRSVYARIQNARPVRLLDEVLPYKTSPSYTFRDKFSMDGKYYEKGFTMKGHGEYNKGNQAFFNLDGNYSMISLTAGIVSDRKNNVSFLFYADGELVYKFSMQSGDSPSTHTFNVVGCKQLVVSVYDSTGVSNQSGVYGIAEVMATRSATSFGKGKNRLNENQVYLLNEMKPYIKPHRYADSEVLTMGGKAFSNGFSCMGYGSYNVGNKVYFNLNENYSRMTFTAGIVLDQGLDVKYKFYTDGVLAYELGLGESDLATTHSFNVEGCKQLMITICDGKQSADASGTYGIGEIIMDKSSAYDNTPTDSYTLQPGEHFLLNEVMPHTTPTRYNDSDILIMGGNPYRYGFSCMGNGNYGRGNETCFTLDGQYKTISFITGIILDRGQKVTFRFYMDGKLAYEYAMNEGDLPTKHTLNVEGCSELIMSVYDGQYGADTSGTYGLANIVVTE